MRKIFLVGLICCLTFLCTGCVKFDYNIEIDKDNRVKISQTQGFNVKFFRAMNSAFDKEFKPNIDKIAEKYKASGYDTKEYSDDNFSGLTIEKSDLSFKEASKFLPAGFQKSEDTFTVNRGLLKSLYKIHLNYNLADAYGSPEIKSVQEQYFPSAVLSKKRDVRYVNGILVDFTTVNEKYNAIEGEKPDVVPLSKLTIKLPVKAQTHNADNVIGDKEYQWDLANAEQPVEIVLEYEVLDVARLAAALSIILLLCAVFYLKEVIDKSDVVKGL